MLFSVPKEPFPELISFTFESPGLVKGRYQAEDGMTFEDWVKSPYNVDGYRWIDTWPPLSLPPSIPPPWLVDEAGKESVSTFKGRIRYNLRHIPRWPLLNVVRLNFGGGIIIMNSYKEEIT